MDLQVQRFSDINLNDSFFGSLRASYPEFNEWYNKKAAALKIKECKEYKDAINPESLIPNFKVPQSFIYIEIRLLLKSNRSNICVIRAICVRFNTSDRVGPKSV